MNYLIISDIHGSSTALQQTLDQAQTLKYSRLILLGDLLYHGSRNPLPEGYNPKQVAEIINTLAKHIPISSVRGNCDSEVDQMMIDFPIMADYAQLILPTTTIFISHGHLYNPASLPTLNENDGFLYGHTHLLQGEKKGGQFLMNPGSIALPKNGNPATFALLNEHAFTIYTLSGESIVKLQLD